MKSATYIAEITNQKNEKARKGFSPQANICLRREIHLFACLLASCQLSNFLREFTEKCFDVFDNQATRFILRGIGCSYFFGNFLL